MWLFAAKLYIGIDILTIITGTRQALELRIVKQEGKRERGGEIYLPRGVGYSSLPRRTIKLGITKNLSN